METSVTNRAERTRHPDGGPATSEPLMHRSSCKHRYDRALTADNGRFVSRGSRVNFVFAWRGGEPGLNLPWPGNGGK